MRALVRWWSCLVLVLGGCDSPTSEPVMSALATQAASAVAIDTERTVCRARIEEALSAPALPGAPSHEGQRIMLLGRATGEPVVFTETPPPPDKPPIWRDPLPPGLARVLRLQRFYRHDPEGFRDRILRGGYLFSEEPDEAAALVHEVSLPMLFTEPEIWLLRGDRVHLLERKPARITFAGVPLRHEYRFADGPLRGSTARLLFADRVAVERAALDPPLHRDVRSLRDRVAFDRIRLLRQTDGAAVAELTFETRTIRALLAAKGAKLELSCLDASREDHAAIRDATARSSSRRRALAALRRAIDAFVVERLPFDRPLDAEDHHSDGQLRPSWDKAYFDGDPGFAAKGGGWGIFDDEGRPRPPQTCMQFVLECYERAAGTWYRPLGESREITAGALDFRRVGIVNRSGVIAFEKWAKDQPELFTLERVEERIPFAERERFFGYLARHAERFAPGDIVAIRGIKRDGNIHQHALLIEDVDPVTGFPHALVDQRSVPRRHSWEGIMGEAPRRSLYFHIKPTAALLERLDPDRRR